MIISVKKLIAPFLKKVFVRLFLKVEGWVKNSEWLELEKQFGRIEKNSEILIPRRIINPKYIFIGKNFTALSNCRIEAFDSYNGEIFTPSIVIGNNVTLNTDCHIACIDKVLIGDNVLFASRVYISDHSHGEINSEAILLPPSARPLRSKGPVIIGDNVWIGEGVSIMSGVSIGKNAIIGANSVVTKNVPPDAVVAGVPAKVLKILSVES